MSQVILDIDEVEPLHSADEMCLREIREVLSRHNRLDRFGITLLHSHFPVSDDEVLLEECDTANRTLTITPVKMTDLTHVKVIETSWVLTDYTTMLRCVQVCVESEYGDHRRNHESTHQPQPVIRCKLVCAMKDTGGHEEVHAPTPDVTGGD